jgi:hypothetical protein
MISVCAGETILGHVMMWVPTIALIGIVFHGRHGIRQNTQPSFTWVQVLCLTVPLAPVTP